MIYFIVITCLQIVSVEEEQSAVEAQVDALTHAQSNVNVTYLVPCRLMIFTLLITTTVLCQLEYKSRHRTAYDNLPGIEDTVIKQAVPPGGDSALHFALLKLAIAQTG